MLSLGLKSSILIFLSSGLSLLGLAVGESENTANADVTSNSLPGDAATMSATAVCNWPRCGQCLQQNPHCEWCVRGYRCVHNSTGCGGDIGVVGYPVAPGTPDLFSNSCPRMSERNPKKILVPAGTNRAIRFDVDLVGEFMLQLKYDCFYLMERGFVFVDARLLGGQIYCGATEFTYAAKKPDRYVVVGIRYGNHVLDNPAGIQLWIYRCGEMAKDRDTCRAVDAKYNCGWCQSSNSCEIRDDCDETSSVWIGRTETSASPQNDSVVSQAEP